MGLARFLPFSFPVINDWVYYNGINTLYVMELLEILNELMLVYILRKISNSTQFNASI